MTTSATLFNPATPGPVMPPVTPAPPPLGSSGGTGAISGGLLRPGAIDQATFLQMLQQEQQNRQVAGVGGKPVSMPLQSFQSNIPTLTSAQFAALVGTQNDVAAAPAEGLAADPQAIARVQAATAPAAAVPAAMVAPLKLSGAATRPATAQMSAKPVADNASTDQPTIFRASDGQQAAGEQTASAETETSDAAQIYRASDSAQTAAASAKDAKASDAADEAKKADPAKDDSNVVHLKSPPDKEQQKDLRMQNKRWVVDETPGARQLFFGADGEFGWDDFLDMINPLQHIPIVAQIYRAVTGDEINGAANLLGALPFGPLGGPGLIASVIDLAVKDVTGKDIGDNLEALVFGKDNSPGGNQTTVPADMADAEEGKPKPVQTAARDASYAPSEASQLHESCRG